MEFDVSWFLVCFFAAGRGREKVKERKSQREKKARREEVKERRSQREKKPRREEVQQRRSQGGKRSGRKEVKERTIRGQFFPMAGFSSGNPA